MKVKVLRDFRDKESKEIHKKDAEIVVSKKRFEEINSTEHGKLVEALEETQSEPPKEDEKEETLEETSKEDKKEEKKKNSKK